MWTPYNEDDAERVRRICQIELSTQVSETCLYRVDALTDGEFEWASENLTVTAEVHVSIKPNSTRHDN